MATRMASREQKEEGELAASRKRRMFDLSRYRGMLQRGGTKQPSRFSQSVDMSGGPPVLPWETTGPDTAEGGKNWDAAKDKPADYPRKLSLDSQDVAKSPHEKKGARRTRSLPKPKGTSEYVVQKSDSLAGIALQFDTTPSELARLNKLPTRMVFPGMMLYVPDPDAWTDEETSVSSSPASPPPSPASTEIPSRRFDLPVVREKEPASQDPGHVTSPAQVVTPSSSRQSSLDELGSQKEDEFHEQFLKINVKYITAGKVSQGQYSIAGKVSTALLARSVQHCWQGQYSTLARSVKVKYSTVGKVSQIKYITAGKGTVSGVLLVTPNAIMFDPHKSDPLVIETGCEEYGLICQMDTVLSAAMYHDIRPMMEPHKRDEIYKSGDYSQEETEPTSSSRSSCHGNGGAPLPGQRSESLEDEVFGGGGVPKPPAGPGVEVAQLVDLGDTIADGGGVVADSGGILVAEGSTEGSMEDSNVPKPQKFVEELVPIIEEKVDPNRLSPRVLSPDAGIDEETDTKGAGKGPPDTVADQVRKSGCSDASDTGSVESGIAEMVDSANQKDSVRPDNNGAISETSSSGQPGLPGVDPATDTATDGVNVQESLNFVDFSCGLFTTEANRSGVQDISEVIPQDSSVQEEIALLKDASKLSEPSEDSELRMTETSCCRPSPLEHYDPRSNPSLCPTELLPSQPQLEHYDTRSNPSLCPTDLLPSQPQELPSQPQPHLLPSQPQSLSSPQGPPLFLCLKVMQMKKSFTGGKEVVNPGSTKLPEYWFAIPKDRADHLYAFFLQWSPDVYGHEVNKADLEVSGFVVLGEETDSLEVVDDFYSSESSLYKDWEKGFVVLGEETDSLEVVDDFYSSESSLYKDWEVSLFVCLFVIIYMKNKLSGFVVLGEEADLLEVINHFYSEESSLYKDWEIVTAMEARRRLSMLEVEDSLPQPTLLGKSNLLDSKHVSLPTLLGKNNLLDSKHVSLLAQFLPPRTEGYAWMLIYSTFEHGISLTTMYKKMVGVDSPVLLVVQDSENNVFGALTSSPVKISEHFYGTGESFLFTFFQDFKVYKWTGDNTFFIKGDKDCLAIGGGECHVSPPAASSACGWTRCYDCIGRTHACTTFNNRLLTSQEDFTIKGLEAWGFEIYKFPGAFDPTKLGVSELSLVFPGECPCGYPCMYRLECTMYKPRKTEAIPIEPVSVRTRTRCRQTPDGSPGRRTAGPRTDLHAGVVSQATGSAYIEMGQTKVIAAVYGPREIARREEFTMKGRLCCELKFATFACRRRRQHIQDNQEKDGALIVLQALEPAVCLDRFPKSQVDVYITVLQDDGSALAAAITCAAAGLADAGVMMYDIVAGCSVRQCGERQLLDPSVGEELSQEGESAEDHGMVTVGLLPSLNQVSALTLDGHLQQQTAVQAVKTCIGGCQGIYPILKDCLVTSTRKKIPALDPKSSHASTEGQNGQT
uniref:Exosome complex component MTR3 n=1 Tax=Branchiostoma floridae TaxID=7739 RepID=C3ZU99_BRAFL|eukprot:XP_002587974.1 hypothetical protein BRAFLDRAFT_124886 [Branchiostoma floridae]